MKVAVSNNSLLSNINEIWSCGEHVFIVRNKYGRTFRVTAAQNVFSSSSDKFCSFFEEEVEFYGQTIWVKASLTAPGAESVKQCLGNALEVINTVSER